MLIYSVDNCTKIPTITQRIKKDINRKLVTVCYISKLNTYPSKVTYLRLITRTNLYTKQIEDSFHRSIFPQRRKSFSHLLTVKRKKTLPSSHYLTRIRLTRTRPWDSQIGHDLIQLRIIHGSIEASFHARASRSVEHVTTITNSNSHIVVIQRFIHV